MPPMSEEVAVYNAGPPPANRAAVATVKDYHTQKLGELRAYFAAEPEARKTIRVAFEGLRPPRLDNTAWELALATQSLAHIEPELAFALSGVYGYQTLARDLERGVLQSITSGRRAKTTRRSSRWCSSITAIWRGSSPA